MFSICKNTHKVWYKNHRIWHGSRNLMIFDLLTSTQGHQFDPRMKILLAFRLPCQFQRFLYQTLCVFSQIKYRKHIESVARVMPQGWDLWVLAGQNFSVGICHGAPLTARSSHCCYQCRYMYIVDELLIFFSFLFCVLRPANHKSLETIWPQPPSS